MNSYGKSIEQLLLVAKADTADREHGEAGRVIVSSERRNGKMDDVKDLSTGPREALQAQAQAQLELKVKKPDNTLVSEGGLSSLLMLGEEASEHSEVPLALSKTTLQAAVKEVAAKKLQDPGTTGGELASHVNKAAAVKLNGLQEKPSAAARRRSGHFKAPQDGIKESLPTAPKVIIDLTNVDDDEDEASNQPTVGTHPSLGTKKRPSSVSNKSTSASKKRRPNETESVSHSASKKRLQTLCELVSHSIASGIRDSTQVQDVLRSLARQKAVKSAEMQAVGESVPVASSARQVVLSSKGRTLSITTPFGNEVSTLQAWAHSLLTEQQIASRDAPRSGATMLALEGQRRANGHISGDVVSRGDRDGAAIKMHRSSDLNAAEAVFSSIAKTMVYSSEFHEVLNLQTRGKAAELMRGHVAGRSAPLGPPSAGRLLASVSPQQGGGLSIAVDVSDIPEIQSYTYSRAQQLLAAQAAQYGQQRDSVKSSPHVRQVGPSVSPQGTQQPGRSRPMPYQHVQKPVRTPSLSSQGGQQHVRSRSMTPQAAQRSSLVAARRSDQYTSSKLAAAPMVAAGRGIRSMHVADVNEIRSLASRTPEPNLFGVTRDQIEMGAQEIVDMTASPPSPVQICSLWKSEKDKQVAAELNSKGFQSS